MGYSPHARVSEIEEDGGDPTFGRRPFEKEREAFGGLLNPTKVLAHCPPILRGEAARHVDEQSGQLPKELLPLIYVRVATINGCRF